MAELSCGLDDLSDELLDLVLAKLPVASIFVAKQVCKKWCTTIRSEEFKEFYDKSPLRKSWFFQRCESSICPAKNKGYGYDPEDQSWHPLSTSCFTSDQVTTFAGCTDGSIYSIFGLTGVTYKREILSTLWDHAPGMNSSRNWPLVGLVDNASSNSHKLIVAGGVSFFEDDDLGVEMYDAETRSWTVCQSLPTEFRGNCSRHWMTSAVVGGKLFVGEIHSGLVASFDPSSNLWSEARALRPVGVVYSHLLSCQGHLILAGSSYSNGNHCFKMWKVNENTIECGPEIAEMPSYLLDIVQSSIPDQDWKGEECQSMESSVSDEGWKGKGFQCVASGDQIFIFVPRYSDEHAQNIREQTAVVCDFSQGNCQWKILPSLPVTSSYNHVFGFSSPVSLKSITS